MHKASGGGWEAVRDGQGRRQPVHRQEATEAIVRRFSWLFQGRPTRNARFGSTCGQAEGWPGPTILSKSFGIGSPHRQKLPRQDLKSWRPFQQNGQVDLWKSFFSPQQVQGLIQKVRLYKVDGCQNLRGLNLFCDLGSPFSGKVCWICCKDCQISTTR